MSEPEIEALMAGQEDENGSVHYEGESRLPSRAFLFYSQSKPAHMDSPLSSFRQAHHVCVRGQQEEC